MTPEEFNQQFDSLLTLIDSDRELSVTESITLDNAVMALYDKITYVDDV